MSSPGLHPRNRHPGRYDFARLIKASPELAPFVAPNPYGELSIGFSDPQAVLALNRALLAHYYGITFWEIPTGYLCPPIPGRADYIHHIADVLASSNGGVIPKGSQVRALDIGVGANCIYPVIGRSEYGWSFVGTDTDSIALASARQITEKNSGLKNGVELRLQSNTKHILNGLVQADELFDLSLCNPPFHESMEAAKSGSRRKWKNLGIAPVSAKNPDPVLNFGGQGSELWYPGGEVTFVRRMIEESAKHPTQVFWFSTLLSKEANLPTIQKALKAIAITDNRIIEMSQGQKKSRVVAWTFLSRKQQDHWKNQRWKVDEKS